MSVQKILSALLVLCLILSMANVSVSANESLSKDRIQEASLEENLAPISFQAESLSDYGTISIKKAVKINITYNYFYPTYDNPIAALEILKDKIPNLRKVVESEYGLYEISGENVEKFVACVMDYMTQTPDSNIPIEVKQDIHDLTLFYDIYENEAKNNHIESLLDNKLSVSKTELYYALPYSSPLCEEIENSSFSIPAKAAAQPFNISDGIKYAQKYAWTANSSEYGECGNGDCTNFVSQILIAGGIKQHDEYGTSDKSKGWWHTKTWYGHKYSYSWTLADDFCRFMGVRNNKWQLFYTFSTKIKKGDFIAYDEGQDGDWDHLGFVTDVDSNVASHNGMTYKDFRVAQHTYNYERWVSNSNNGWEDLQNSVTYAIVRAGEDR